jgi:hypothetical protein
MRFPVAIIALCAVWDVTASCAQRSRTRGADSIPPAESKAWVEHAKQGDLFVTQNASYDFVRVLGDDGETYTTLLVLHTDRNEWSASEEGINGTVTLTAWRVGKANEYERSWSLHAPGNVGRPLSDLRMFQVSNWPCCSAPFENIYFSLHDGRKLYTTNGVPEKGRFGQDSGLVTVNKYDGGRHSQTRYVGFGMAGDFQKGKPTLQYGTDEEIKQRFSLLGREYGDNFDVPQVYVTGDGKQLLSDLPLEGQFVFTIVLKFEDGNEALIPVENDVVRADKATLPAGYSLRLEKQP